MLCFPRDPAFPNRPLVSALLDFYAVSKEHDCPGSSAGSTGCAPDDLDRPFIWSNTVISLDGVISFSEKNDMGVNGINCRDIDPDAANEDFLLLQAGWAQSDAIILGASSLRNEQNVLVRLSEPALIEHRRTAEKSDQPMLVIVSASGILPSGNLNLLPLNTSGQHVIIVTTNAGKETILKSLGPSAAHEILCVEKIRPSGSQGDANALLTPQVDFKAMVNVLKKRYHVNFLDVSAGGVVCEQFIRLRLLDEVRFTLSLLLAGQINTQGDQRPVFFPESKTSTPFTGSTAPRFKLLGLRAYADRMLFLRMRAEYRH